MAEIQTDSSSIHKGVKRIVKKSTRVDLTPMVDLGFLLITFFVFTTTMATPRVMNINTPYDTKVNPTTVCETCALSIILDSNNIIYYYEGIPEKHTIINQTSFSVDGIREVFLKKKDKVKRLKGNPDEMVAIIKSTDHSSLQNFIDVMDEIAINDIKHYFLDEVSDWDKELVNGIKYN